MQLTKNSCSKDLSSERRKLGKRSARHWLQQKNTIRVRLNKSLKCAKVAAVDSYSTALSLSTNQVASTT
jgi:hypothetical protein